MIPSHKSRELAETAIMKKLHLDPVLDADMALGEGTGAVMMMSLLDVVVVFPIPISPVASISYPSLWHCCTSCIPVSIAFKVLVMCADNGVVEEQVSQSGKEVTLAVAKAMGVNNSSATALMTPSMTTGICSIAAPINTPVNPAMSSL